MNDTSPKIEYYFNEMLMKKSGQERIKMGFSMFDLVRKQVMAAIKMENPHADIRKIKREMFLRFYKEDFSVEEQEKIFNQIIVNP